jgi:hypothetical protein
VADRREQYGRHESHCPAPREEWRDHTHGFLGPASTRRVINNCLKSTSPREADTRCGRQRSTTNQFVARWIRVVLRAPKKPGLRQKRTPSSLSAWGSELLPQLRLSEPGGGGVGGQGPPGRPNN